MTQRQILKFRYGMPITIFNCFRCGKTGKKRLELEENRLSTLLTKYDAGIISRREIIESEVKVLAQRQAVLDAILDFNLKNEALRNFIER